MTPFERLASVLARIVANYSAFRNQNPSGPGSARSPLFEIARVLVRLDHVASIIVNANHSVMGAAAVLRVMTAAPLPSKNVVPVDF